MNPTIAARVTNLIIFIASTIALLAVLGHAQRKDRAYLESARQVQAEQKYAAVQREGERMTSYERIGK